MFKASVVKIYILLNLLNPAQADAKTQCTLEGAVRCPCEASLMVKCDGKAGSFMKNDEMFDELTLQYQSVDGKSSEIVVRAPTHRAREYYNSGSGLLKMEEIQKALKENNIPTEDIASGKADLTVTKFTINSNVKIYSNPKAIPAETTETVTETFDGCEYLGSPRIVKYKGRNTCMGYFTCSGQIGPTICIAKGNTCPSPDSCANDQSISFDNPEEELPNIICMVYFSVNEKRSVPNCRPRGAVATLSNKSEGSSEKSERTGGQR